MLDGDFDDVEDDDLPTHDFSVRPAKLSEIGAYELNFD